MSTVVPGDLILLSAGNLVPADGVIVAAGLPGQRSEHHRRVFARRKEAWIVKPERRFRPGPMPSFSAPRSKAGRRTSRRRNRSGTAFGEIVARLRPVRRRRTLRGGCDSSAISSSDHGGHCPVCPYGQPDPRRPAIESLLFAVALAVGISPELLPVIVSVTLAAGARAMARRGVIVRRLEAIEGLGSMDVLCTDKTGTLTAGAMASTPPWMPQEAFGGGASACLSQCGTRNRHREPAGCCACREGRERGPDDSGL